MTSWGIADTAPEIKKIKAKSADYLNGLNSCGVIDWDTYNYAFDFYMDLLNKAYEQAKKDASSEWIPVSERLPEYGIAVLTVNSDDDYEVNHIIDDESGEWFYDGVIAWTPLPEEPYKGGEKL